MQCNRGVYHRPVNSLRALLVHLMNKAEQPAVEKWLDHRTFRLPASIGHNRTNIKHKHCSKKDVTIVSHEDNLYMRKKMRQYTSIEGSLH